AKPRARPPANPVNAIRQRALNLMFPTVGARSQLVAFMNVSPGSSFFQTVPGSAARPDAARAAHGPSQMLQAQSVEDAGRAAPTGRGDAPVRPHGLPIGPRGSLVDIIA